MGVLKQVIDPYSSILHPCCGPDTEVLSATSPVQLNTISGNTPQERNRMKKEIIIKNGGQESR